jgi:xylulokinase
MSLFIGIDSGTQSTKAVVLDLESGQVVAEARAPHTLIAGLPAGYAEQHPADWTAALDSVLREVAGRIAGSQVRGIGVSGQQHGFVPLDADGAVIRPAKLWCDTSTTEECAILTRRLGGQRAAIRRIGMSFLPGYTAPKILWLRRHEPANYRRLRQVLLPHDYLNFYLTGIYRMECGDASGTALLDVRRRRWSAAAINAVDPRLADWLPPLGPSDEAHGLLRADHAATYGFGPGVVVSAGGGDNMMGAIGTGNVRPGVVTASFGTSGTIFASADRPVIDAAGEIAAFCSSTGGWLPLLCTMNLTAVTTRVGELLGFDHAAFDAAVAAERVGAGGLMLLPYLAGERTPNVPDGTGVLLGLGPEPVAPAALARAAVEGVTLGMNYGLRRLEALGVKPKEIRVTGGGARSPVWRQLMADVFGVPVVAMVAEEGAALGAALQAAWCCARRDGRPRARLTDFTAAAVAVNERTRCRPDRERSARYRELQAVHDQMSVALRDVFTLHRRLAAG